MGKNQKNSSLDLLQNLNKNFTEVGIKSKVIEKENNQGLNTLLVSAEKDYKDRDQFINLAYLLDLDEEHEELLLLQYFTEIPIEFEINKMELIKELVIFINARMPIGHFSIQNQKIHYRYVMVDLENSNNHILKIIATFFMYIDSFDIFQESIEAVILGEMTIDEFKIKF